MRKERVPLCCGSPNTSSAVPDLPAPLRGDGSFIRACYLCPTTWLQRRTIGRCCTTWSCMLPLGVGVRHKPWRVSPAVWYLTEQQTAAPNPSKPPRPARATQPSDDCSEHVADGWRRLTAPLQRACVPAPTNGHLQQQEQSKQTPNTNLNSAQEDHSSERVGTRPAARSRRPR